MPYPKTIAFQGEPGSASEVACHEVYPKAKAVPCQTFEDCFAAVGKGPADVAMIPIENTVAGRVADIHHLLPNSRLQIVGEHFLPIHFQLVAPAGATLKSVKTVHSHIQALSQCRKIIRRHRWKAVVSSSTAAAAREVADANDITHAALSPIRAAEINGLEILMRDVEDAAYNATRFIILSNEDQRARPNQGKVMTTVVFRVRNVPAALYKALGGFATNSVNITKLESYQLDGQFVATQFFVDVEGHPDHRPVSLALEEVEFYSTRVRILGVYPASPFRVGWGKHGATAALA